MYYFHYWVLVIKCIVYEDELYNLYKTKQLLAGGTLYVKNKKLIHLKPVFRVLPVDTEMMNSKMEVDELCFIKANSTERQFRLYF